RLDARIDAARTYRVKQRVVPVGDRTGLGAGGEIGPEPLLLGRSDVHGDRGGEDDHVPTPEIVAVISLGRIARRRPEVAEVARGVGRQVVVLTGGRLSARLLTAPGGVVAGGILRRRAAGVGIVPGGEDGTGDAVEQPARRIVIRRRARPDVACTYEDGAAGRG